MKEPISASSGQAVPHVLQRRRAIGAGVIGVVLAMIVAAELAVGFDRERSIAHIVALAVQVPPLLWLVSVGFAAADKRRFTPLKTLVLAMLVTGLYGGAFGVLRWFVAHQLHLHAFGSLARSVAFGVVFGQLFLGLWALAFVVPFALEDARVRSLEAEKLRTAAELARLRGHLEPHFLLNTLSAIAGLVVDDPKEARRLLVCLGDLLRDALRDEDEMQPLSEQIAWLRRYAEILEARHGASLAFRWEIGEETVNVMLPRLLLQPLVENAVKHGALRRASAGEVVIRTEIARDPAANAKRVVVCTIEDNGPGVPNRETRSGAFGLHAVRRRLELKYMEAAKLRLESTNEGTRSIVELPLQTQGAAS